jgi:hypothetical protein
MKLTKLQVEEVVSSEASRLDEQLARAIITRADHDTELIDLFEWSKREILRIDSR